MIVPVLGWLARHWALTAGAGASAYMYREEIKRKAGEVAADPVSAAKAAGEQIQGLGTTLDGFRSSAERAGDKIGETITDGKSAFEKAKEFVGLGSSGSTDTGGGESGINWGKILGFGGGTAGALWGLSKLFGGGDKKEEGSGFSFGNILMMAGLALAVWIGFKNKDELSNYAKSFFNKDPNAPSTAQVLDPPVNFNAPVAVTPLPTSDTPLGQQFAAAKTPEQIAQDAIDRVAGRPVRATVEGPVREVETLDIS